MANEQNLKYFTSEQSHEEAVKNGQKGGIASGIARRQRKLFKERLMEALDAKVTNSTFKQQLKELGMDSENATNEDLLVSSLLISAFLKNDTSAIEMILTYIGESPKEKRDEERATASNDLAKAKAEAIRRTSGENIDFEDDGFISALDGKIDNSEWDEFES